MGNSCSVDHIAPDHMHTDIECTLRNHTGLSYVNGDIFSDFANIYTVPLTGLTFVNLFALLECLVG